MRLFSLDSTAAAAAAAANYYSAYGYGGAPTASGAAYQTSGLAGTAGGSAYGFGTRELMCMKSLIPYPISECDVRRRSGDDYGKEDAGVHDGTREGTRRRRQWSSEV